MSANRTVDPTTTRDELILAASVGGLLLLVTMLSMVGAGVIARPLFMISAMAFATVAKRRSPWLYLNATLWFWLVSSFARRIIEWRSGFNPADIVLVTPHLMTMLILPDLLNTPGLLKRRGIGYAVLLTACVFYGMFVSFVRGDVIAGLFSATDWVMPLLYLYFFICNARRIDEAEGHLAIFLPVSLLFVVSYSVYQYFQIPDWDAQWMVASGMGTVGYPLPMGSRVFGPMANGGILSIWSAMCVVLLGHFRTRLLLLVAPFLFLVVVLCQVRAVYGSLTLAVIIGALIGRGGFTRLISIIVLAGISGYGGITALDPTVIDQITTRLQTFENLKSDDSAQVRGMIYAETPRLINDNPFGIGIGAQGRGNVSQDSKDAMSTNIDSGPLSVFLGLGWVAGPLYLFGMMMLQVRAFLIAKRLPNEPMASTMAAAAIVPLATFPFINILGLGAVFLWICYGYVLALEIRWLTLARPAVRKPVMVPSRPVAARVNIG
jgi:hypothetical protein